MIPNDDCLRHTNESVESIALWKKHKGSILAAAISDDLQEWVSAGINSYGFAYAARYHKFNLNVYLKVPSKFYNTTSEYKKARDLLSGIEFLEAEATQIWNQVAPKIESELPKKEWKKYLEHLNQTQGPAKYALDLGIL